MKSSTDKFSVRLARSEADIFAAQRLRYDVFVQELGADTSDLDHELHIEKDKYDAHCDHLLLIAPDGVRVVGVYRLMTDEMALKGQGFYGASEYDLSRLVTSGRRLLELGRSCVHPDFRGGAALHLLWGGLGEYVMENKIDILFGVASFHGTDVTALAQPLSWLHQNYLAPAPLRTSALGDTSVEMDILPVSEIDPLTAVAAVPALIKAYLRLGGYIGSGAFIDYNFNTTDVCLIMDTAKMTAKYRAIYSRTSKALT